MSRKFLVTAISFIYMMVGLLNIYYSLIPNLFSNGSFGINLFQLIGGALAFHAGSAMFRLDEFGRKLVIFWLCVRVVINSVAIFWTSARATGFQVNNFLGESIYKSQNPYALPGFLLSMILIALFTIMFLSQQETKAIFLPETTQDVEPDIILE